MKKLLALSTLLSVASATVLSVSSASAQTVPIISGTILYGFSNSNVSLSNVVTSLGVVNITANSLNGNLENLRPGCNICSFSSSITSSVVNSGPIGLNAAVGNTVTFNGTASGTSPNGSFTDSLIIVNSINESGIFVILNNSTLLSLPISSGTIALPAKDFLPVTSNLLIANSVLPSSDKSNPEYRQEYNNGFSSPSSSRILPLDIK